MLITPKLVVTNAINKKLENKTDSYAECVSFCLIYNQAQRITLIV